MTAEQIRHARDLLTRPDNIVPLHVMPYRL
jgi:hypothetical protein